jgi:glutamyl-tRNA reductase
VIVVVGLSHKTAPIEVRERLAISRDALPEVLGRLVAHPTVGGAVVLSTCNRVEVYAAPKGRGAGPAELRDTAQTVSAVLTGMGGAGVTGHLLRDHGNDAVVHLFRVAASLDSLVVGEPQILGQLKDAIDIAKVTKTLGSTLGNAMHRAVRVGKRVRTETAIGEGQVSVSSVAIDLAREIFGELKGHTALLVGAGEMAEAASKLLVRAGARLIVVNRSPERAAALAADVGGEARPWSDLERSLVDADIVVSSTSSPRYVITTDLVKGARKARKGRSLFLIDIAVPRDVDPAVGELPGVTLLDMDDLRAFAAAGTAARSGEVAGVRTIIEDELERYLGASSAREVAPMIVSLRDRAEAVREAEIERYRARLGDLHPSQLEAVEALTHGIIAKLLHEPQVALRDAAGSPRGDRLVAALRDLFALDDDA